MDYRRGSEWRMWDLHVHTPESVLNNQFGNDWDLYVHSLFTRAIDRGVAVLGITDYFSIDGYKKLKTQYLPSDRVLARIFSEELSEDEHYLERIRAIRILPNIEFRLDTVVTYEPGQNNKKLQCHIIFSDSVSCQQIEDNFLHALTFTCNDGGGHNERTLTRENIIAFGGTIKTFQPEFAQLGDYAAGCTCVAIPFAEIQKKLGSQNIFKGKHLIVMPEDDITRINWADQGHQIRKNIYVSSHMIFSSNPRTIEWGLKDETQKEFGGYKPCIWGSDAHSVDQICSPDRDRYCWIKADPTFEGLKQVLFQPKDRVFIGAEPSQLQRIRKNGAKFIDRVSVKKSQSARNPEVWFDFEMPLNAGLTAIIGNKGAGKSAFSDIIGLLCSCSTMPDASFLSHERFRKEDKKLASDYEAELSWVDQHRIGPINLQHEHESFAAEYAQYLPQKYVETVCNGLDNEFQAEIDDVIFSYLDKVQRGGATNLKQLIEHRSRDILARQKATANELHELNERIVQLEDKCSSVYRAQIANGLEHSREELRRHDAQKPEVAPVPSSSDGDELAVELVRVDKCIQELEQSIRAHEERLIRINRIIDELTDSEMRTTALLSDAESLEQDLKGIAQEHGLDPNGVSIKVVVKMSSLLDMLAGMRAQRLAMTDLLSDATEYDDTADAKSLRSRLRWFGKKKSELIAKTSQDQQRYQQSVDDLREWEKKRALIIGDVATERTLVSYEAELRYLDENLEKDLDMLYQRRRTLLGEMHDLFREIVGVYEGLYHPIQQKLASALERLDDQVVFSINISAIDGLDVTLLSYFNQSVQSRFRGKQTGMAEVGKLVRGTDFDSLPSTWAFVESLLDEVQGKLQDGKADSLVAERVRFYDCLSSLEFLRVEYTLRMGGRTLKELSPGQRGIVLLIFYLALSQSDMPIIIDQPEDNLDNQSVFKKLVPCICEAKAHRQVIIVTHNPNIAVACDAEQIIYCEVSNDGPILTYQSGSIENENIRGAVVAVLEGTMPAFDLRKAKYTE